MTDAERVYNTVLWVIGPDDAPNAIEYEQSDGQVYLLCKISESDATGLGMFTAAAARAMGMDWRQSLKSRRSLAQQSETAWDVGEACAMVIDDGFVSVGCQEPAARHITFGEQVYHVVVT